MKPKKQAFIPLDEEEKELIESIERGEWKPIPNQEEEIKKLREAAAYTIKLRKTKNVNLRLTEGELLKLKERAAEVGLPYQTLIATLIRQYTSNKITITL